jgi:hypothetical protein
LHGWLVVKTDKGRFRKSEDCISLFTRRSSSRCSTAAEKKNKKNENNVAAITADKRLTTGRQLNCVQKKRQLK